MAAKRHSVLAHGVDLFSRPAITGGIREMGPIVSQHCMDFVRYGRRQGAEKVTGDPSRCLPNQLGKREFGCSVNGYEEIEPTLCGLYFGDIDMEITDRIGLELPLRWLVAVDIRQAADAVALQAPMQRRPSQVRDGRLQGVEAIVERQQRMATESHDDRLVLDREDRRPRLLRAGLQVGR